MLSRRRAGAGNQLCLSSGKKSKITLASIVLLANIAFINRSDGGLREKLKYGVANDALCVGSNCIQFV